MNTDKLNQAAVDYQKALGAWFKAKDRLAAARKDLTSAEKAEREARVVFYHAEDTFKAVAHRGVTA